jgi:hypothetical protein
MAFRGGKKKLYSMRSSGRAVIGSAMAAVALTILAFRDTAPDVLGLDEITTRDVRGSLQELSNKLSQSAFFLSSRQLSADEARGSAAARRRSTM